MHRIGIELLSCFSFDQPAQGRLAKTSRKQGVTENKQKTRGHIYKESLRQLATSMVTAGVLNEVAVWRSKNRL